MDEITDAQVERAAEALWNFDYPHALLTWSGAASDGAKVRYRQAARAALYAVTGFCPHPDCPPGLCEDQPAVGEA